MNFLGFFFWLEYISKMLFRHHNVQSLSFYRVDKSGNRKGGGSGLGLAIVKHIIEAHQEKLLAESKIGVGSEFSFTIKSQHKESTKPPS